MVVILDKELKQEIEREVTKQMKKFWSKERLEELHSVLFGQDSSREGKDEISPILPNIHMQETKLGSISVKDLPRLDTNSSPAEIYECDESEDEGLKRIREHENCTDLTAEEEDYLLEQGREKDYEEKENGM